MSDRTEVTRPQLAEFTRSVPFEPLVIMLENSETVTVKHAESIAFHPEAEKNPHLLVLSDSTAKA